MLPPELSEMIVEQYVKSVPYSKQSSKFYKILKPKTAETLAQEYVKTASYSELSSMYHDPYFRPLSDKEIRDNPVKNRKLVGEESREMINNLLTNVLHRRPLDLYVRDIEMTDEASPLKFSNPQISTSLEANFFRGQPFGMVKFQIAAKEKFLNNSKIITIDWNLYLDGQKMVGDPIRELTMRTNVFETNQELYNLTMKKVASARGEEVESRSSAQDYSVFMREEIARLKVARPALDDKKARKIANSNWEVAVNIEHEIEKHSMTIFTYENGQAKIKDNKYYKVEKLRGITISDTRED
ncbi:MAG: hypothetical protein ACYCQJ_13215 [Nitrososphaerales archaeon]